MYIRKFYIVGGVELRKREEEEERREKNGEEGNYSTNGFFKEEGNKLRTRL